MPAWLGLDFRTLNTPRGIKAANSKNGWGSQMILRAPNPYESSSEHWWKLDVPPVWDCQSKTVKSYFFIDGTCLRQQSHRTLSHKVRRAKSLYCANREAKLAVFEISRNTTRYALMSRKETDRRSSLVAPTSASD